jgi:hypothetical protein
MPSSLSACRAASGRRFWRPRQFLPERAAHLLISEAYGRLCAAKNRAKNKPPNEPGILI